MLEEPRIEVLPPEFEGYGNGAERAKAGAKKPAAKGKKGKAAAEEEPSSRSSAPREERHESFAGGGEDKPGRAFSLRDIR